MEHIKTFSLQELIAHNVTSKIMPCIWQELQNSISNNNTLFLGFGGGDILDFLDNGRFYYAIPKGYKIIHCPRIRPFKTVVVDTNALPFAPNTFEIIVVNHYLEFFEKSAKCLDEIFRILKPEGKLLAVVFNKRNFLGSSPEKIRPLIEIVSDIMESSFHPSNVWGINRKARFLSYNFSCDLSRLNTMMLGFFQLLANVVIITADKKDMATESVFALKEKYEAI
ncbi:MAG: class I SAM-dependent methyltransferase [Holosporaceae bacterium]|jgi:SAM-dependent methyltransferase|nr:class I SAM-dependent methyltransferase [Holosporaceae bacterium]